MVDPDCKKYGNRSATEAWALISVARDRRCATGSIRRRWDGGDGIYRRRTCGIGRGYAAGNSDAFRPGARSAGFEAAWRSQIPGDRKDFRTAAWHGDVAVQSGNQEIKEVSERVWNNRIN